MPHPGLYVLTVQEAREEISRNEGLGVGRGLEVVGEGEREGEREEGGREVVEAPGEAGVCWAPGWKGGACVSGWLLW